MAVAMLVELILRALKERLQLLLGVLSQQR